MASTTTKRGLNKPARTDYVNVITDINENMDNLDNAVPDTRTVNGHALSADVTVTKGDVGLGNVDNVQQAPITRTINGHALSSDVTITKSDVGLGNVDDVQQVPATRKVNNKALSSDVTLYGSDIPVSSSDSTKLDTAVIDLKSAFKNVEKYVMPNSMLDFSAEISNLTGLTISEITKYTLKAKQETHGQTTYWIPIDVVSGKEYIFYFDFTTTDGSNVNVRVYDTNKTTLIKAYATSKEEFKYTADATKTIYLRLYFLNVNTSISIVDSFVGLSSDFGCLIEKIGIPQLTEDMQDLFCELTDEFNGASETLTKVGITSTKSGNAITWLTTATSAYMSYNKTCKDDHKYILYYDVTGTLTGGNYAFSVRLIKNNSFTTGNLATIDQTSGADASGTVLIAPTNGQEGELCFNLSNKSGESISGDLYLYEVTGLTQEEINAIDWSSIGIGKIIIKASSGSSSQSGFWGNKKVVFYGDSITQTSYPEMVQAKLGFTLVKNAKGGSKFGYLDGDNSFSDDNRIAEVPTDADVVCIMGGTNDWARTTVENGALTYDNGFDRTKFKGAVAYTVQKMQVRCPNARIYLLTNIGGRGEADTSIIQPLPPVAHNEVAEGNTPLIIRNATIEVANELNIPVIDTWSCGINGLNRAKYIADTVHPTNAGQILIAEYIVNALINDAPW